MVRTKKAFTALITSLLLASLVTSCSPKVEKIEDIPAENNNFKAVSGVEENLYMQASVLSTSAPIEENREKTAGTGVKVEKPTPEPAVNKKTKAKSSSKSTAAKKSAPKKASSSPKTNSSKAAVSKSSASSTPKAQALDWWSEGQYVFPRGAVAKVTDLYTGKKFNIKRTYGTNHADCESLTLNDSNIIKSIWGGWSWVRRPIILEVNGRRIAASMAAMPHAGLDKYPANEIVEGRSGGYGTGTNLDAVKGNGMDGHFDVHFLNSRTHGSDKVDSQHQAAIKQAINK